jgi:hypothetical protein
MLPKAAKERKYNNMTDYANDPKITQLLNILNFVSQPDTVKTVLEQLKTDIARHETLKKEADLAGQKADAKIKAILDFMEGTKLNKENISNLDI